MSHSKIAQSIEIKSEWTTLSLDGPWCGSTCQMTLWDARDEMMIVSVSTSHFSWMYSTVTVELLSWVELSGLSAVYQCVQSIQTAMQITQEQQLYARNTPNQFCDEQVEHRLCSQSWMHKKQMAILLLAMSCHCSPGFTAAHTFSGHRAWWLGWLGWLSNMDWWVEPSFWSGSGSSWMSLPDQPVPHPGHQNVTVEQHMIWVVWKYVYFHPLKNNQFTCVHFNMADKHKHCYYFQTVNIIQKRL